EELRYFSAGESVMPFVSRRLGKIGVAICEDSWHLSVPYLLAVQGAKMLVSIDASPLRMDGSTGELAVAKKREMMNCTYANLLSLYVAFANRAGNEDGVSFWGGSQFINPNGNIIAEAAKFVEATVDAAFDLAAVKRARLASSHFSDEDTRLTRDELQRILSQK
ncbi:MAG: acyltransferase, partial [Rhizobacter sp.]|nr:acyltransferase [Chlorobiales bacterium]